MLQVRQLNVEKLIASLSILTRPMADHRSKITSSQGGKRRASALASDPSITIVQPSSLQQANGHGMFQVPPLPGSAPPGSYAPKVAIPRLRRESDATSASGTVRSGDKHRISHACEPCRSRKTKCSGEKPTCRHCEDFRIKCVYGDGKRDKAKKSVFVFF